ncbi:transmembrane 7 superfamily member 3-like [Patiria miniata]|uniref:TM7S3/TM198-like domain-containing protein n=1 Tax=Patiria miniata TaxID=46514 RepID=A0A914BIK1_PATMI|nr:transmembrane 7 superfamily member 3-like [Patiria miniata]
MKPYLSTFSFMLCLQVLWVASLDKVCDLGSDGRLHLNLSTPTQCSLPPYANLQIQSDNIDPKLTSFILFTIQTPNLPVQISLTQNPSLDYSINGSDVGLVSILKPGQTVVEWFLTSSWNFTVPIQLFALPYYHNTNDSSAPIPGACNQEFDLENEPNLHLHNTSALNITLLEFAAANVGVKLGDALPTCDVGDTSLRFRLTYELYVLHLGALQFNNESFFNEMMKMSTVDNIIKNGEMVQSFEKTDITEFYQVNYRSRGFIYNVIVTDPVYGTRAAYVPAVVYSCELKHNSLECQDDIDFGVILIATFTGLAGLVICLFGHRIFNYEVFFFGFVPLFIGSFMVFGSQVPMSPFALSAIAAAFGLLGGAVHFLLWWRFGKYLWSMLLTGLNLGFLFSALVFFVTPLENLSTFHSNTIYGLSFSCGVLIVPVVLLYFPKVLSIVASAIWGSYLVLATISYFTTGIFHYLLYNVMRRAIMDKYAEAHHTIKFEIIDIILFVAWLLSAIAGALLQRHLTKHSPTPFPACPYREWKKRQQNCNTEPDRRGRQIQTFPRDDVTERSPLMAN